MQTIKFTWKGFVPAPLLVPFLFSAACMSSIESRNSIFGFLVFFALGSILSYGTTVFLFLPSLYLISKFTSLTARLTCLLGGVLGAVVYIPFAWQEFMASGNNSGPPQGTFVEILLRDLFDPLVWAVFPVGRLVTATVYWILVNKQPRRDGRRPA